MGIQRGLLYVNAGRRFSTLRTFPDKPNIELKHIELILCEEQ